MAYVYTDIHSTCCCFLVLAVNSAWFQKILQSYTLLLKPPILMHSCPNRLLNMLQLIYKDVSVNMMYCST